jgi:RNA polymerase sigma-70 factor (ECF subfamily)
MNRDASHRPPPDRSFAGGVADLERYRRELTAHCCRMLGSTFEAHDAVQETMVRAWRSAESFEGRSTMRTWLYRIATNVCIDMLRRRRRQARPIDLGPSTTADVSAALFREDIRVHRSGQVASSDGDPAEVAASRETVRLAFATAIQHLPERQRAVLFLRDVLRWRATEVAGWFETSVASVNSAHQRARAKLAALDIDLSRAPSSGSDHDALIARYVAAFQRYDIDALLALLAQRNYEGSNESYERL